MKRAHLQVGKWHNLQGRYARNGHFCGWTCTSACQLSPSWLGDVRHCTDTRGALVPVPAAWPVWHQCLAQSYRKLAGLGFSPEVQHGSCCAVGTVIPPAGRAAAVQPAVGLALGGCVEIGSDSHARFLATFDSREAVVPESNVHCQLWGSSLFFIFLPLSHFDSSSFGSVAGTFWILKETFFWQSIGSCSLFAKFWVYSDVSNVILFSSSNRGQGPVVSGIVKMPCKRLYIIQMGYRESKQKEE